jgi:hypothetical protein
MKRITISLAAMVLALILTACLQHTYDIGTGAPEGEIVYRNWHHHWLFGLIRPELQKQLDLEKFCPSGNATIHQEQSFVNGLINILIGVIYSPTTVEIRCDAGETARIELDGDVVARIVTDPRFEQLVLDLAPDRLAVTRAALVKLEPMTGDRRVLLGP